MIQEFSITNCLSIKDTQTISFKASKDTKDEAFHVVDINGTKLLKVGAIYGANASGKTNMLAALNFFLGFIFSAYTDLKPDEETGFQPFEFDPETRTADGTFKIVFFIDRVKYQYVISLNKKAVSHENLSFYPNGQIKLIFERIVQNIKFGDMITGNKQDVADRSRANASFFNTASQFNLEVINKVYTKLRQTIQSFIPSSDSGLLQYSLRKIDTDEKIKESVLQIFKHADFSHISNINFKKEPISDEEIALFPDEIKEQMLQRKIKPQRTEVFFEHSYKNTSMLPLRRESAGTRRVLAVSVPLIQLCTANHFQTIDELETSLHPELVAFFLKTFLESTKENNIDSQLLFTTHNTDLLESDLLRDDEIWFAEKTDDGSSEFNRISDFTGVRKGVSRKTMYEAGKFGARPLTTKLFFQLSGDDEKKTGD